MTLPLRARVGIVAAGLSAFAFRWLTFSEFTNDHFDHVALAQQLLLGAWPVRDFTDEGLPLTYAISAAGWALLKQPFLSEAIIATSAFALAAALGFRLAFLASGSVIVGAFAAALQVALYPRSYSYPKLLVQAVALTVAWWAIERLTTRRIAALAAATALGYYFRHDHALYIGAAIVAMIGVAQGPKGAATLARTVALYTALVFACVLPHLLYVQWAAGLPTYLAISRNYIEAEATGAAYARPVPAVDRTAGLWQLPDPPVVNIRWKPAADDRARQALERRYQLEIVEHAEGTTWRYRVRDMSTENLEALRADGNVDDTHGFENLSRGRRWRALLTESRPGPGWRVRENSLALLFWLCWLSPVAAIALLIAARQQPAFTPVNAAQIAMVAVLGIGAAAGFLRNPIAVRLPDTAVPFSVLGACIVGTLWRWPGSRLRQAFCRGVALFGAALVLLAATTAYQTRERLTESRLFAGVGATAQRWRDVSAALHANQPGPVPSNPSALLLPFFKYVQQCTEPEDRLFYAWYSPEVYIVADRGFAGDHRKFFAPFHATAWEQARTIERLKRQSVPFVIIPSDRRVLFESGYPDVWRFLQTRYVPMTSIPIGGGEQMNVLRDTSWRSRTCP